MEMRGMKGRWLPVDSLAVAQVLLLTIWVGLRGAAAVATAGSAPGEEAATG